MALTEIKQGGLDDEAVNEAKLQISNAGTNGQYLQKSSNTGGLTWATVDTSTLMPLAGGTFTNDVTFEGNTSGRDMLWDKSRDSLVFKDNAYIEVGTGTDLQIYHNGTDNYIKNVNGTFKVLMGSEYAIQAVANGAVELYHNDVKKLNTESYGVVVQEDLKVIGAEGGGAQLRLVEDEGDDNADNWKIMATGNYFYIQNYGDGAWETNFSADPGAGVSLYYNNVAQCYTNSVGLKFNDDKQVRWGTNDDMRIYHDNAQAIINNATGILKVRSDNLQLTRADNEVHVNCVSGNQVELNYSGNKKLETTSNGIKVHGANAAVAAQSSGEVSINIGSTNAGGAAIYFDGDSNGDWVGSDYSWIRHRNDGDFEICCDDPANTSSFYLKVKDGTAHAIDAITAAGVKLYYDGTTKFETVAKGIKVNSGGSGEGLVQIIGANSSSSTIEFGDTDDDDVAQIWYDHYGKNMHFRTSEAAGMKWYTDGTERMKLTDGGWFKAKGNKAAFLTGGSYHEILSDNANNVTLALKHDSSAGYGVNLQLHHSSSSKYAYQLYSTSDSVTRFVVRGDGDCENSNNSYGSTSDVKLKENIVDAKSQWDDIKGLRVRNFNFKADTSKTKMLGLVAQEAELVAPGLVKEIDDIDIDNKELGTKTKVLKYSILYMKAIKALQEAMAKIEVLETKVAALEAG